MVSFGRKSKKESTSPEAAVSSIPVPPAENSLVIDLPEGQKLVLGRMEDGTVIEVATWRGTGRPDSRTNRLMLGVSSTVSPPTSSETSQAEVSSSNFSGRVRHLLAVNLTRFIRFLNSQSRTVIGEIRVGILGRKTLHSKNELRADDSLEKPGGGIEDFQFDAWLQSIEQGLQNKQESATTAEKDDAETSPADVAKKKVVAKASPRRKKSTKKPQRRT